LTALALARVLALVPASAQVLVPGLALAQALAQALAITLLALSFPGYQLFSYSLPLTRKSIVFP
jgi:hypothetical protein